MGLIVALVTMFAVASVQADEVLLVNGDRISGTLVELTDGKLSIKTTYAGTITIDWTQVQTFSTDNPLYVTFGENTVRATIPSGDSGTATIESEDLDSADSIDMANMKSLSYEPKPAVRTSGWVNIGASTASGNTNVDKLNANAEFAARTDKNRFTVGGQINRAKDNGAETELNWLAYMKYDHFISKQWYAYANASGENDDFKDINLRTTLGGGGGYQVFETKKTYLLLEFGANYVSTDFTTAKDQDYPAARFALDFSRKLFDTEMEFFNRDAYFGSLDDSGNAFLRTRTGLRMPVIERLDTTIQFNYGWDGNPAPGRRSEDKLWLFTLGYRW